MGSKKGIGQRDVKEAAKDSFIFDSWLFSNKSSEDAMCVGADMISMVKTNTEVLYKENIEKLTKDWLGGSYLVLRRKPMVHEVRPMIFYLIQV